MEPQQQAATDHQDGGKPSNYLCRQSGTRWTPTTDQIRILKDLYYNNGIRSPTTDQIQKISARLRKYGEIEGKNVFYWFQNHKARERQKKRFTANTNITNYAEHHMPLQKASNIRYPNFSPGVYYPSPSAAGVASAGQMVGGCGYEHTSMESNPRECAMPPCGNGGLYSFPSQGFQWNGMNPYNYPASFSFMERSRFDDQDQDEGSDLETLPLFPMHGEDYPVGGYLMRPEPESYYATSRHWLSLNSYGDQWPNF